MKRGWAPTVRMLAGLAIMGVAIFANQIGLDHNTSWGKSRIITLILGFLIVLHGLTSHWYADKITDVVHRIKSTLEHHPFTYWWRKNQFIQYFATSKSRQIYLLAGLASLFVILVYIWFVSVGYWTIWPKTTYTYDLLATAFQHGQLSLDEKPNPALLALSDPYDTEARKGISFPWDASLYQGKYYLYWGPVPALILAAVKPIFSRQIGDQYLVFAFLCGAFVFSTLFILVFWRRFFHDLPGWTVWITILLAGLVCPAAWMLNRPAGYEAAIASSQFFFIGGLYFAYRALEKQSVSKRRLVLAGIFWISAIGSRTTAAIPVLFMAFMVFFWIAKAYHGTRNFLESAPKLAALAVPLGIGALVLGWYNWARFGSVFEFGFRYQLTWINLNKFHDQTFSPAYLLPNLYNYLINPFEIRGVFPFLKPRFGQTISVFHITTPDIYRAEEVTGLPVSSPFVLLAIISVVTIFSSEWRKLFKERIVETNKESWLFLWVSISLIGSILLSFAPILFFFYATMRYLEDIAPTLILLSSIGFWQGYQFYRQKRFRRISYILTSVCFASLSIAFSLLLAVTSSGDRFKHLNRALLNQIIHFFSH